MQFGHEEVALAPEELSSAELLLAESSSFAQEMTVKLRRNTEKIMSICLTRFLISGFGEPYIYHKSVEFTRMCGFFLEISVLGIIIIG